MVRRGVPCRGWSAGWQMLVARLVGVFVVVALFLTGGSVGAAAAESDGGRAFGHAESAVAEQAPPSGEWPPDEPTWDDGDERDAVARFIPDPGNWPGHESAGSGSPLSAEQEARLQQAAAFYLRDGSPNGTRAYLVYARHLITGGPSAQDWIDAAKYVGGFVIQTSAAVVAVAGCPVTSGATCLIATALANAGGACLDGCDTAELAVNVVAIGLAIKAGYAIRSTDLGRTEQIAARLVADAAGDGLSIVEQANRFLPGLPPNAPVPLGRGSTGRFEPKNLKEQMAMTAVRANPRGSRIGNIVMHDERWPASEGWVKMRHDENGVVIHYVRNEITGAIDDFKFK